MSDWLRSITVIAITFVGVIVVTLGLATVLVPQPTASDPGQADASDAAGESPNAGAHEPEPSDGIPHVGGALAFSGDREGTLELTRDSLEGTYGLLGSDGRITIGGSPRRSRRSRSTAGTSSRTRANARSRRTPRIRSSAWPPPTSSAPTSPRSATRGW
jgi:hypothetical protein